MSKRQVDFSVLHGSQNIIKMNHANAIVSSDSNGKSLVIATDVGYPVIIDLRAESLRTFQNPKNIIFTTPTAIAVNQHSDYIITGHSDGSICVFSTKENFSLILTFKGLHKSAITAIGFAKDNDFYVGDASGLTTRISFGKIVTKLLTEKEINRDPHPVTKIIFTKDEFMFEAGFVVMTDHFILIDPTRSHKEQVTGRSGNFSMNPSIILLEGSHGNVDVYAFSDNVCHYYNLNNASYLNYSGFTKLFKSSTEIVTNAMLWSSKMILVITNFAVCKFINTRDITLSIERKISEYDEFIVERRQSPLSQVIISQSIFTSASNDFLYCVHSQKVVKMNFASWKNKVIKYSDENNWEGAFKLIINTSKNREFDAIGLSDRISDQNLSIKQLTESVITKYLQYAIEQNDEELIERSISDCIRISTKVSIQKFILSEIMPIIENAGHIKVFYSTIFQGRPGRPGRQKNRTNDFITPELIKKFLSYCQKNNELEFAERNLMRVPIPKNYANDIASIIYDFGLTGIFTKIMVFSFADFITPCIILENDFDKLKVFLTFIYSENAMGIRAQLFKNRRKGEGKDNERRKRREGKKQEEKRPEIDWNELDRQKKKYGDDHDHDHGPGGHGHSHGPGGHDHDHDHGPGGHGHDHGPGGHQQAGYAEEADQDEEGNKGKGFGRFRETSPEEAEKRRLRKLLAQRTICLWLFCPTSMLGFTRLAKIIDNDLELATIILRKCSTLLPLKYAPNYEFNLTYFADSVMQVLNQRAEGDDIKYEKFLPILDIICPLYAEPEVDVTRCALRLTTNWCFRCHEEPQSTRIAVINKIRSKYPTLINEEDFMSYSIAAGFRFAVEAKYLSEKRYDIIVQCMICDPDDRSNILEFLNTHLEDEEEVKKAILENAEGLVLINSDDLYNFVAKNFPDLNEQIIGSKLTKDIHRFLYLNSLLEVDEEGAKKYYDEIFELTCKLNPSVAILFFQEHSSNLDIEKAKTVCEKYHVSDCFVTIAKVSDNQEEAIKSVERALVDVLELEGIEKIEIRSETQLGQYPPLVQALNAVDALLLYQKETVMKQGISEEDMNEKNMQSMMAQMKFLRAFNFPFYVSREKPTSVRKILFIMFTHFVIGSMDYIPVKMLFGLMFIYIRQFDFDEICEILAQVSDEIEFKERRTDSILQMTAEDTCHLIDEVFKYTTMGRKSSVNVCCSSCLKPLSPPKYGDVLVFPCGHMFHDEQECWQTKNEEGLPVKPEECPICSKGNDLTETLEVQIPNNQKKLSKSQMNMLLRRLDFALKRNYGSDVEDYRPSSVYFASESRDIADALFVPQKIELAKSIPVRLPQ